LKKNLKSHLTYCYYLSSIYNFNRYQKTLGEHDTCIGDVHNMMANVLFLQEKKDEALIHYEQSVKIYKLNSENPLAIAQGLNNIAIILKSKGELEKALEYYQESLKIKKSSLEENSPSIASTLNNIASLYQEKELYEDALVYCQVRI